MSSNIIVYFFGRIGFYFIQFLDSYFRGSFNFFNSVYWKLFFDLDAKLAFNINLRYFRIPLWRQYSFASYFLSIPIRGFKIIIGAVCLLLFSIIFWLIYLLWVILPVWLLLKTFFS